MVPGANPQSSKSNSTSIIQSVMPDKYPSFWTTLPDNSRARSTLNSELETIYTTDFPSIVSLPTALTEVEFSLLSNFSTFRWDRVWHKNMTRKTELMIPSFQKDKSRGTLQSCTASCIVECLSEGANRIFAWPVKREWKPTTHFEILTRQWFWFWFCSSWSLPARHSGPMCSSSRFLTVYVGFCTLKTCVVTLDIEKNARSKWRRESINRRN